MAEAYDRIVWKKGGGAWVWKSCCRQKQEGEEHLAGKGRPSGGIAGDRRTWGTDYEIRCTFDYTEVYPKSAKKDKNGSDQFQEVFAFGEFRSKFAKKVFSKSVQLPEPSDDDDSVAKQLLKWYNELDIDALNKKMASVKALLEHGTIHHVEHS